MRAFPIVNFHGLGQQAGPLSQETLRRLCSAVTAFADWEDFEGTATGDQRRRDAVADVQSIVAKSSNPVMALQQLRNTCHGTYLIEGFLQFPETLPPLPPPPPSGAPVPSVHTYKRPPAPPVAQLPPPIETLPMVPTVSRFGRPSPTITPQNIASQRAAESLQRLINAAGEPVPTGGGYTPPVTPPEPPTYEPISTGGGYTPMYEPLPTGPRYTETPARPVTEYEPGLRQQIESYDRARAEFESRPPTPSQYEGRMTPQEVATEAARRHEEWVKGMQQPQQQTAAQSSEFTWNKQAAEQAQQQYDLTPPQFRSEVASVDCGPGRFWDGKQCRGSQPPGGMSDLVSQALQFGPSGGQTTRPATPTGGGYGGYQLPPPTPSGPMFGPNVMTGRVLGRCFPVVNL